MMSPMIIPIVILALCGLAFGGERRPDGRIVGGEATTIDQYPYTLSLRKSREHFCGATIIGPYHALTNARCLIQNVASSITLHEGTSFRNVTGTVHRAVRLIRHPQFNNHKDYDYAIIEVATPFTAQPVQLCSVEPSAGQTAAVLGWGMINDNDRANQLQVVNVPTISRADCQSKYEKDDISQRMICAGTANGGKDYCSEDIGGPFIVDGKQCGIASWSNGCWNPTRPGVYANVADQISWIKSTIGQ